MPLPIASSSGAATTDIQNLTAHGFVAGNLVYHNGTTWLKASAALGTSIAQAVVSQVIDVNNFRVVYSGVLTITGHGLTVGNYYYLHQTVAGTTTATHPTTGIVQQVYHVKDANTLLVDISNAFTAVATTPDVPLTYGRVNAFTDLPSTVYTSANNGVKIPFDNIKYSSGITFSGTDIMIPSITGRYRVSWLMQAGSGGFASDGYFCVIQNGVLVDRVLYDMMEAAGVNQCAGFIDVDLTAGLQVHLKYQSIAASDTLIWQAGSYFQIDQLPTAVAPIVDVVAEYGESNLAVDFVPTVAFTQMTGMSVTLPTAGTYRIRYDATAFVTHAADTTRILYARLYDSTNAVVVPNSLSTIGGIDNEQNALTTTNYFSGGYEAVYTVGGATTIELQGTISALPTGTFNFRAATASTGGTKMTYQKIAGGLPTQIQTWTDYTPTVTSTTGTSPTLPTSAVISGSYTVTGKVMTLNFKYFAATTTGGADGTQSYRYSIPAGYTIDTAKAAIPTVLTNTSGSGLDGGTIGAGFGRNSSLSAGLGVVPLSTTSFGFYFEGATRLVGAGALAATGAANTAIWATLQIPIL